VGDRAKQHDFALFMQFQKGLPPRLCLAKFDDDGLKVVPDDARGELDQLLTRDVWNRLIGNERTPFNVPSFCAVTQYQQLAAGLEKALVVGTLEGAIVDNHPLHAWYTGVSSITWDWATMNLQQAIGEARLSKWGIDAHYVLWRRILDGVAALHDRGYLHGDLRPANIFCRGAGEDPDNFFVGDYGSFSSGESTAGTNSVHSGNTLVGPDVGRGRSSPFYSMERRAGIERETADTAIIIYDSAAEEYRIWLGWKSQVLDEKGELKNGIADDLAISAPAASTDVASIASLDNLRPGDRIRLRDEVFKVKSVTTAGGDPKSVLRSGLFCICDGSYATVVHDRLTVRNNVRQDRAQHLKPRIVALSSFTELRQWSAATDLFSIGALFLYTLYSSGRQLGFLPNTVRPDQTQVLASPKGSQTLVTIDAEFRQLMMVLESVPYLRVLWPDLDYLWKTIIRHRTAAQGLEEGQARSEAYSKLFVQLNEDPVDAVGKSLPNVVSNITQSVPNIKVILQHFKWNMVRFVLFMHFVLRCLHRTEHLGGSQTDTPPFCEDRTDKPRQNGSANEAFKVLSEVWALLEDDNVRDTRVVNREVPDYDVRSEFSVKIDNAKLEKDLAVALKERDELVDAFAGIRTARLTTKPSGFDSSDGRRARLFALIDAVKLPTTTAVRASDAQDGNPVAPEK
jgi:serine/threonine protein kinase